MSAENRRGRRFSTVRVITLLGIVSVFIVPYLWMAASSLMSREDIFRSVHPVTVATFVPQEPTLANFSRLLSDTPFALAMLNSIGVGVVTVVLGLVVNSTVAYALVFLRFRGQLLMKIIILSTLLVPFEALMVSMSLVVREIGLYDNYAALVLPWVATAFVVLLLVQQFSELPSELIEAATVDGASHVRIYGSIVLPNVRPALVSAAFVMFLSSWEQFIWPLIITSDPGKIMVNVAIGRLFTDQGVLWELVFPAALLATIPVVILFMALQRYYVQGVVSSGFKG